MNEPPSAPCTPHLAELAAGTHAWRGHTFTIRTRAPHPTQTVWLCTCGRSRTQPFCDGTHNRPVPSP